MQCVWRLFGNNYIIYGIFLGNFSIRLFLLTSKCDFLILLVMVGFVDLSWITLFIHGLPMGIRVLGFYCWLDFSLLCVSMALNYDHVLRFVLFLNVLL